MKKQGSFKSHNMKGISIVRWFRNVSIAKKLYFTVGLMALLIAIELGALVFSINTLSSVRAYVAGEGLWSKAQKDAMYQLLKYGRTRDEADYVKFEEFMKVPMGDHKTLLELSKPKPDIAIARQGFLEGRNHPDDIDGMIKLFQRFNKNKYISGAIVAWMAADSIIPRFYVIGEELHNEINADNPSQERINAILGEINPVNVQITPFEDKFSYTLGEGSRWLENLVLKLLFSISLSVELTGLLLAIAVSRSIQKGLKEILLSAQAVAKGDFSRKAEAFSKDEIGIVANDFNKMADALQHSIQEIGRAQRKFEDLMESAPDAMVLVNAEGIIQVTNKQCATIFGYKKDDLVGHSVDMLFPERLQDAQKEHRAQFFSDPTMRTAGARLELPGRRSNREEFPVEISLSPLITEEGVLLMSAALRDVTEKKLMEEKVREANITLERKVQQRTAELELKNKELEQFAYVASHDLQEPLRTTTGFVDALRKQYKGRLDEHADRYLNYIAQSSDRMKTLIKDLLDYSRIGRQKQFIPVDCNDLLKEVLADLDTVIRESGAVVKMDDLPVVPAFPTELKLLFQNLISNSIKFRKQGTKPCVKVGVEKMNGYWQFAVQDNGIGIDPRHQDRIFVIFQRLHNRADYEGSGIGLAHCKKIVELHGGKIWVASTLGAGSTFFFTISEHPVLQENEHLRVQNPINL
jgi:PAS domain S-box-containing protein